MRRTCGSAALRSSGISCRVRLVVGELDVPLRRRLGVEGDGEMGRLLVLEDVEQRLGKPVERGGVHAFGRENGAADEREVRPIDQRHPIQQKQFLHHKQKVADSAQIARIL